MQNSHECWSRIQNQPKTKIIKQPIYKHRPLLRHGWKGDNVLKELPLVQQAYQSVCGCSLADFRSLESSTSLPEIRDVAESQTGIEKPDQFRSEKDGTPKLRFDWGCRGSGPTCRETVWQPSPFHFRAVVLIQLFNLRLVRNSSFLRPHVSAWDDCALLVPQYHSTISIGFIWRAFWFGAWLRCRCYNSPSPSSTQNQKASASTFSISSSLISG